MTNILLITLILLTIVGFGLTIAKFKVLQGGNKIIYESLFNSIKGNTEALMKNQRTITDLVEELRLDKNRIEKQEQVIQELKKNQVQAETVETMDMISEWIYGGDK